MRVYGHVTLLLPGLAALLGTVGQLEYTELPRYDDIRRQLAGIICEIGGKAGPSSGNVAAYRDIDWTSPAAVLASGKRRQSNIATQVTPPKAVVSGNRKRVSSDNDANKVKMKRPKKVLEVNNHAAPVGRRAGKRAVAKKATVFVSSDDDDDAEEEKEAKVVLCPATPESEDARSSSSSIVIPV